MSNEAIVFSPGEASRKQELLTQALHAVSRLEVTDVASADVAAGWLGDLQDELKAIKAMKESALKPMRESEKQIRDWFRPLEELLTQAVAVVKQKIGEYDLANKQLQREAFARASEQHQAGNHIAARAEIQASNEHAARTGPKGTTTREVWEAQIVDASLVPREWCIPDEKRIAAMARSTHCDADPVAIPGVQYVRRPSVTGRRSKK